MRSKQINITVEDDLLIKIENFRNEKFNGELNNTKVVKSIINKVFSLNKEELDKFFK